jgi:preprotein translocase SecE subunit
MLNLMQKTFENIKIFLKEVLIELKKVNWPTREEAIKYSLFVIGFSALISVILGFLDFIYIYLLRLTIFK